MDQKTQFIDKIKFGIMASRHLRILKKVNGN